MRLIDADALIHTLYELERRAGFGTIKDSLDGFKLLIDHAPTVDAVPVVRCKDCKHLDICKRGTLYCLKTELIISSLEWFCKDGERLEDDN